MALATRPLDGRHGDTTALGRALAALEVRAPHTGEPLSEPMLLGIGGGLGGGYWMFEFTGAPKALVIGARHRWHLTDSFLKTLCERLGQPFTVHETGSARTAAKHLAAVLETGRPFIAWVDQASMPYLGVSSRWERFWIHLVGVRGADPETGEILVEDRAAEPWRVPAEQFDKARAAIPYNKFRLLSPQPRESALTLEELRGAILDGIRVGLTELTSPPIKNFGLPAFAKWADLVANRKNKKGWPTVFAEPSELLRALGGVHHGIETNGTGGGAFRPLYAEFLDEAAEALQRPSLREAAEAYRALGEDWSALAVAALPDREPLLRRTRELAREKDRLLTQGGASVLARVAEIAAEAEAIETQAEQGLSLTASETEDLLLNLRTRLLAIVEGEQAAAGLLARIVEDA